MEIRINRARMDVVEHIKANDGYCVCKLEKTADTKCICREFIESKVKGLCNCGLYEKLEV